MGSPIDLTLSPVSENHPDRSFFCASIQINKNNAEMRIDKFCISSNQLEGIFGLTFKSHIYFSIAAQRNTIYILGGEINGVIQKSVSSSIPEKISKNTRK